MRALESLIQNMLGYVRGQVTTLEPLDLDGLLDDLRAVMQPQCHEKVCF